MSSQDRIALKGAEVSIVRDIVSTVIIPGDSHKDLWVHPDLVTIPGNPITVEMALRSTDREGRDQHTTFNYFRSDDNFVSLYPITGPTAPAWKSIGLTSDDLAPPRNADLHVPGPPEGEWHWARNYVHIDSKTILQPFLTRKGDHRSVQTLVGQLDGDRIVPLHISNAWSNDRGRGLLEPQIADYADRLYMTVRAEDERGYVLTSNDKGRTWTRPTPWTWENGDEIPMRSTMTKLLSHSDGLLLVYTRVRDDNGQVFRQRAPLHCADVDPETLSLRRTTERIIVPNRGLPVGNFWVCPINRKESYVAVAEWPRDNRKRNGDVWLAKIRWKHPNLQMTDQGREVATSR